MASFSVVVPTYNRRERVLRAIASVRAQSFRDFEVVVVDDGSTDGTAEALASQPGLQVVRQSNRGAAAARNAGARRAGGEYLAFLDSDDTWPPWTLASHAALVERHAPAWTYGRRCIVLLPGARDLVEAPLAAEAFPHYAAAAARSGLLPVPSGVTVRRDVFARAQGFCEALRIGEDVDLWFRLGNEPEFVLMQAPLAFAREVHKGAVSRDLPLAETSMAQLVRRERRGLYPGDPRLWRAMLASELMGYAWQCQAQGRPGLALRLYARLLELQLRSDFWEPRFGNRRNRYLASFPLRLLSPRLHEGAARAAGRR